MGEHRRIFLGTCGGGAGGVDGFLQPPEGAGPAFTAVAYSVEIWAEAGDIVLQLRANEPDTLPNQQNLLEGLICFGEMRTKRRLVRQALSLWGAAAGDIADDMERLIRHYEDKEGQLNLD